MNPALYWLVHVITCILPIVSSSLFLFVPVVAVQNYDKPITEGSVSSAFAAYPNYDQLLTLLMIASTLIFATTAIRNVQVRIWFRRRYGNYLKSSCSCCCNRKSSNGQTNNSQGSSTYLAFANDVASVINVLAYVSFVLLAIYPADAPTESQRLIHNVSTVSYFCLSIVYSFLQTALTYKQGYPKYVSIIQLVLAISGAVLALAFVVTRFVTENPLFLAEWLAVVFNLLFIAFFAVLFHIDSASDELVEFFCPCCCGSGGGGNRLQGDTLSPYKSMA